MAEVAEEVAEIKDELTPLFRFHLCIERVDFTSTATTISSHRHHQPPAIIFRVLDLAQVSRTLNIPKHVTRIVCDHESSTSTWKGAIRVAVAASTKAALGRPREIPGPCTPVSIAIDAVDVSLTGTSKPLPAPGDECFIDGVG